jgi:cytochrome c biogenesis protein
MKTESGEDTRNGWIHGVWHLFSSIRLTVGLLLGLAATSIIGTLIPQNADPVTYFRAYGNFFYRLFFVLGIYDMYHSWWFQMLLLGLTINVLVCSINRLSATWRILFVKVPTFHLSQFQRQKNRQRFTSVFSADAIARVCTTVLAKRFGYSRLEPTAKGFVWFAEKGRWTRLGVYIVHFSVVCLLFGGMIGAMFGFEAEVNIPEGQTISAVRLLGSQRMRPLGFGLRCDHFSVSYYDTGTPREYRSRLTVIEDGKPVVTKDIIVNDPLHYRGINFFQSSWGTLPPDTVTLRFTSRASGMVYTRTVKIGQRIDLPEGLGGFRLTDFRSQVQFKGHDIGEAFRGELMAANGPAVTVILPVKFADFDQMRNGAVIVGVSDYQPRYYTGLQVNRDPGVWVVYLGFLGLILGCVVTFFCSHQRLCVEAADTDGEVSVTVMGMANKNQSAMADRVSRTVAVINAKAAATSLPPPIEE